MSLRHLWVLLVLGTFCLAQETYYADVVFDVSESGSVVVSGRANHPMLKSQVIDSFTSKRGGYWLLNITLPQGDVFSDYVYVVRLPQGASVNYVKSTGSWRITTEGGRIAVSGVGGNETLGVVVQYQIGSEPVVEQSTSDNNYYLAAAIVLLIAAAVVFLRRRAEPKEELSYDPNLLSPRQSDIMRIVRQEGKPVNQSLVCERLNLPKSSVSRNVESLVKMGLLKKTRNGMSTMLYMAKD